MAIQLTLEALIKTFDLSNNTRKHHRFRIERVAEIKETRVQKCTCGEFFCRLAVEGIVRDARRAHHPETRVCFFAVPIVVLLTFEMINGHIFREKI